MGDALDALEADRALVIPGLPMKNQRVSRANRPMPILR
jgi:hypothetical protein